MAISCFWNIPEKRKFAAGALIVLIVLFFLVLVLRSCRKPEGESTAKYKQGLTSSVPENRADAVLGLGRLGVKSAVPDLEKILTADPDERVRRSAAYSILILDREKFLALLNSPDGNVRALTLETIGRKEKEKAYSYLEKGLSDPLISVRRLALSLILKIPGTQADEEVLRLAEKTTEDSALRIEAVSALGQRAGPEILDRLKYLAGSGTDFTVRAAATAAVNAIEAKEKAGVQ